MIPSLNVKSSVPTLPALQLVKGVKKDEETFVAHHLFVKPPSSRAIGLPLYTLRLEFCLSYN